MSIQRIVVFQEKGRGENKIRAVRAHGQQLDIVQLISIDAELPLVIDDAGDFLPPHEPADLVLDYLVHPDLSFELARRCAREAIPVVASGKKIVLPGVFCPPTCCGLGPASELGPYAEQFGAPRLEVRMANGNLERVRILREAPCGCTRTAVQAVLGLTAGDAVTRFGLAVQTCCTADPSGWDPMVGTSPIHFAGHIHGQALKKAIASAIDG